jgi:hypothetical protein
LIPFKDGLAVVSFCHALPTPLLDHRSEAAVLHFREALLHLQIVVDLSEAAKNLWLADKAGANCFFHLNWLAAIAYFLLNRRMPWSLHISIMSLVRVAAANWCLRTQLKVPQPDHSHAFSDAKTAATFIRLNAEMFRCVSLTAGRGTLARYVDC